MNLVRALSVAPGITSVVGSGGKTSLISLLARELRGDGSSGIVTTTTHILPAAGMPCLGDAPAEEIAAALREEPWVCVGMPVDEREGGICKLAAPSTPPIALAELADYVLAEADGSRHLPLKAHGPREPQTVPGSTVVCVTGAHGLGRPVGDAVHRPRRFCQLTGAGLDDVATPASVAAALLSEDLAQRHVINVALAKPLQRAMAQELAERLESAGAGPVVVADLRA